MIIYDLICENGHEFEGWFKDSSSYEVQETKGMVICTMCNSNKIKRLLRGSAIKSKEPNETAPVLYDNNTIEQFKQYQKIKNYVIKNFDDVGDKFADEARKIHYGESEKKNIRGTTSKEEEKSLKDEGVQFIKFPFIKYNS